MHLARFPRLRLAHLPTPLEPMERLSAELGGPNLWIKRDDCTGLAGGGNKTRKLEFLMADAVERRADTVITQGATQSNHARQTAAAAAKLDLQCHLLLEDRAALPDEDYRCNGNVLLDRLHGATLHGYPGGTDMNAAMEELAGKLRDGGGKPYIVPGGGSNEIGALGYVNCALELLQQANDAGLEIAQVVHATGSTGTQAGLVTGFRGSGSGVPVLGISVRAARDAQEESVFRLAERTAEYLGVPGAVRRDHVVADSDYVGPGYGLPAPDTLAAIRLFARTEGILLHPVYTGKAAAGLIALARKGRFAADDNVVFVHTGGAQALFAYRGSFGFTDQGES